MSRHKFSDDEGEGTSFQQRRLARIIEPIALDDDGREVRLEAWHRCGQRLEIGYRDFDGASWLPSYRALGRTVTQCPHCQRELQAVDAMSDGGANELIARTCGAERVNVGRGGLPEEIVAAMWIVYQRGASLEEVGVLFDRTRQSVYESLHRAGIALREKQVFASPVEWQGRQWTPGKHGYFRATDGARELLHVERWRTAHGDVPAGMKLCFKDGDRHHCALDNLELRPAREQIAAAKQVQMRTRRNQFTARPMVADETLFAAYQATGSMAEVAAKHGLGAGEVFERVRRFCLTRKVAA